MGRGAERQLVQAEIPVVVIVMEENGETTPIKRTLIVSQLHQTKEGQEHVHPFPRSG